MNVAHRAGERERVAEFAREHLRIVSGDRQAAASIGTVQCERGDDHGAAGLERTRGRGDIALAVIAIGQKMEDSAVVPHK